ncbi:MAG TPA: hypothetical protein VF509_05930 [Sphingobium sp.]
MTMADNKGDRAMRERAYQLAESGSFANVHAVEQALIGEGWPNVGEALSGDYARKAIQERLPDHAH